MNTHGEGGSVMDKSSLLRLRDACLALASAIEESCGPKGADIAPSSKGPRSVLTTRELAERIKRAPETLERWRRQRSGPPYIRTPTGRVLYDVAAVDQWLADGMTVVEN